MTTAISVAKRNGAKAVICASTGNTSASAAAYATKAGMTCAVLVPDGKIAMGKLSQAIAHGATLLQVEGNFDDCLTVARKLAEAYPVELVNSVNPARIEGQKTAAFEVVDALGDAPDIHCLPGRQRRQHHGLLAGLQRVRHGHSGTRRRGPRARRDPTSADVGLPGRRRGARSSSATRSTTRRPSPPRSASATPPPGGRPRRRATSRAAGSRRSPTSRSSTRTACCPRTEGIFVEPGSAASVAGLLKAHRAGQVPRRRHRRLHRDRPRPQGPAVGAAHRRRLRGRAGPGARRRLQRRGRRSASRGDVSGDALRVGAAVEVRVPGEQREPRPGLRLGRAAPSGVWDTCRATVTDDPGLVVTVEGEGADEVPLDATHLVHRAMQARLGRARRGAAGRACASSAATTCRTAGGWARRRRRSSPASSRPRRCTTSSRGLDGADVDLGLRQRTSPRGSRGTPTTPSASVHGGVTLSWSDDERPSTTTHGRTCRVHPDVEPVVFVARRAAVDRQGPVGPAAAGAPRRRRRQLGPRRAARRTRSRSAPGAPARRPPATGCTRRRGARRTPRSMALVDALRADGHAAVVSGAGPSVLVLDDARPGADAVAAHGGDGLAGAAPRHPAARGAEVTRARPTACTTARRSARSRPHRRGATLDPATAADAGSVPRCLPRVALHDLGQPSSHARLRGPASGSR